MQYFFKFFSSFFIYLNNENKLSKYVHVYMLLL